MRGGRSIENTGSIISREKSLAQGASSLTDVELLALFLRVGMQGKNVLTLAKEMLQHLESPYGLLFVDYTDFSYVQKIGIAKYAQLRGIAELARCYYKVRVIEEYVPLSPEMAREFLWSQPPQEEHKIFLVVFMDSQYRMAKHGKLFSGTLSRAKVHPRGIVREAIKMSASAVIFAHNHPPGCIEPSKADKLITERVVERCQFMDIQVLDHLVIGHGEYISFAERGRI